MMDRMRNFITSELSEPAVFCNMISDWPALSWTPQTLHSLMNNKTVKVRLGPLIPDKDGQYRNYLLMTTYMQCYENIIRKFSY